MSGKDYCDHGLISCKECGTAAMTPDEIKPSEQRNELGRRVREVWIAWAKEQPNPKPSWLTLYEELTEPEKEVDRRIGEAFCADGKTAPQWKALYDEIATQTTWPAWEKLKEQLAEARKELDACQESLRLADNHIGLIEGNWKETIAAKLYHKDLASRRRNEKGTEG